MNKFISQLIYKKLQNKWLDEYEFTELKEWIEKSPENQELYNRLMNEEELQKKISRRFEAEQREKRAFKKFAKQHLPSENTNNNQDQPAYQPITAFKTNFYRWLAAAVFIAMIATLGYRWFNRQSIIKSDQGSYLSDRDLPAGKDGAVLTLADGSVIVLDSTGNGLIARQNGTQLILKEGQLSYNASQAKDVGFNTISTPKGRQFQLSLPDGSRVWLNAASSITFPTAFKGKERVVQITGEVYFEISRNAVLPFRVKVSDQVNIEVLGTEFNVNTYTENNIYTTLLQGSVKVRAYELLKTLKPGQQVEINQTGRALTINENISLAQVMAWKEGLFNFENASLEDVMSQLERWYDIDVEYEHGIPEMYFGGEMSRNISLSGVLKGLEGAGVQFRMKGARSLVVSGKK